MGQGLADAVGLAEPPTTAEHCAKELLEQVGINFLQEYPWAMTDADMSQTDRCLDARNVGQVYQKQRRGGPLVKSLSAGFLAWDVSNRVRSDCSE